jgi:hypothetical protein
MGDVNVPDAQNSCFQNCATAHPIGASDAQLLASDCCNGGCALVCPPAACIGMGGIAGQPDAMDRCYRCALMRLKAGTCGQGCIGGQAAECQAYVDCLEACP